MKRFLILCILMIPGLIHAQETEGLYVTYQGILDKRNAATVILHLADTAVSGYFYDNSLGEKSNLQGSVRNGELYLKQLKNGQATGNFTGSIKPDFSLASGTWSDVSSGRKLKFEFRQIMQEGSVQVHSLSKTFNHVWRKNAAGKPLGCQAAYTFCYVSGMTDPVVQSRINETLLHVPVRQRTTPELLKAAARNSMEDDFAAYLESYLETFEDSVSAETLTFIDESPSMFTWDYQETNKAIYNEHYLLCMEEYGYSYTGGAHGNYGFSYRVFDLSTGNVLQLHDLFTQEKLSALAAAAERQLRADRGIAADRSLNESGLFIDQLELKEDFFIDQGGIGFLYNPYEIASYADGAITVYLKWEQVRNFIKPVGPLAWVLIR